jgi:abortive infection bacteriophage resistance protein
MGFENLKAKSKQQIANEYGICTKTLARWLRAEGILINRGLINPKKQKIIYKRFGSPKNS